MENEAITIPLTEALNKYNVDINILDVFLRFFPFSDDEMSEIFYLDDEKLNSSYYRSMRDGFGAFSKLMFIEPERISVNKEVFDVAFSTDNSSRMVTTRRDSLKKKK